MKKIALIVLAVILVAVVVAVVIADTKFGIVIGSPRISHDTLVKPETRAQLSVNVPLAKDIIKNQFLKGVNIPDSVLPYGLPYEAGLIVNLDAVLGEMNLSLFINDRRLGPVIMDKLNGFKLPKPLDEWFTKKMESKQRGLLLREGVVRLNRELLTNVKATWAIPAPSEPLRLEGNHLVELVVDNRDGSAATIVGTIAATKGFDIGEYIVPGRLGVFADATDLRLTVDLTPQNALKLHFVIEFRPEAEDAGMSIIKALLEMGMGQIEGQLGKFGGSKPKIAVQGKSVVVDIDFPDANALLAKLL